MLFLNRSGVFVADCAAIALAVFMAYWARLGPWSRIRDFYLEDLSIAMAVAVLAAAPLIIALGLHRALWRYVSALDVAKIIIINAAVFAALIGLHYLAGTRLSLPRTVPFLVLVFLPAALGGPRIIYRICAERVSQWRAGSGRQSDRLTVLIVGDGRDAELFIRASSSNPESQYKVVGIFPTSEDRPGGSIFGVPILGATDDLGGEIARLKRKGVEIKRLAISQEFLDPELGRSNDDILAVAQEHGIKAVRLRPVENLQADVEEAEVDIRPISIEDLLGRKEHELVMEDRSEFFNETSVLVTGGGGSIGSELVRQISRLGIRRLVIIDNCEFNLYSIEQEICAKNLPLEVVPVLADVRKKARIRAIFNQYVPDIVFHTAALKHVPLVESNPGEAVMTNVLGTKNVIDLAVEFNCKAGVYVSTDKAVNPTSFMGATKRTAELYIRAKCSEIAKLGKGRTQLMTVRFGNVLGSSGSVVPLFEKQLLNGGPLTVTHPQVERFFMTIPEAVSLIIGGLLSIRRRNDFKYSTYFLDMGTPIKITDLASQMIRLAGFRPNKDVKIVYTGLRPGEKLFEELSYPYETIINVNVPGMYALASGQGHTYHTVKLIENAIEVAGSENQEVVRRAIEAVVPEYQPSPERKAPLLVAPPANEGGQPLPQLREV